MNRDTPDFQLSDFNHRGELRTPKLLLVALAFLSRYPVMLALGGLSTFMLSRRGVDFEGVGLPPLDGFATCLPALTLLAVVLMREKLASKAWARALLRSGRAIAVATCVLQLAVLGRMLWMEGEEVLNRVVIEGLLVGYAAAYMLRSRKAAYYLQTVSRGE